MRRAMSPAIWRTSTRPPAVSMPTDICSFSRLDFSARRVEELARRCTATYRTVPLTGYRFTCTLKTFMKIETRRARPLHERRLVDFGDQHDLAVGRRDHDAGRRARRCAPDRGRSTRPRAR